MRVHIRLLGGFGVTVDGRPVPDRAWHRRSAAGLVKLLALQPERRLRREQVVDALWPDRLLDEAAPRLHVAAHYARVATGCPETVVLARGSVSLFPGAEVTVDVADFERAADAAREYADPEAAATAAALYPGTLLPDDVYEPWTEAARERLRLRQLELLRAAGRYEELVDADPLDEEARLWLVRKHLQAGRRQSALRSLDEMADLFQRELGVDPSPVAVALRRTAEALPVEVPVDIPPADATDQAGPTAVPEQRSRQTPRPAERARSRLPAPRNRLIGRTTDLEAVATLLGTHRVVTITGPGGAGKSTLALALARDVQSDGEDRVQQWGPAWGETEVVLAELAPVRDEAGVTRAVAESAGVQGQGAVETGTLAANVGPRPVLLVLDNCEHLLDASAALVDAILDAGAQAHVLVTSREPLGVDGEAVHRIGSLGRESAELFVERAVAAAGAGVVTADDPRVVDLCARLDGLPLAIELAAAQLRHLSLDELSDRLDDRLALLVGGRPKAGARHSALTATIEWSYRLLSHDSREVFDRLGVFPSSFDLAAAQAVTGGLDAATVTNVVGDLVAKSLVVHDPTTRRYRLLETIRLFAARRLEECGTRAEVTELLRRHVVARSSALPRVRTWLSASVAARSRDDLDNVRLAFEASLERDDLTSAVDVALSISTLWRNAVSYAEGRRWVATLRAKELSPDDRLWTLILAADVGLGSGDPRMMRAAATEAAALAARLDDPAAAVVTDIYDAMVHLAAPARAADLLLEAAERARAVDEPGLERLARSFRLVPLRMLGRTDGLDDEADALIGSDNGSEYDRYICLWASSLVALVGRNGTRLRRLMDAQLADLMATGLRENWLTMYWEALALIGEGGDYVPQLRRARRRAEAEGRRAEADWVLALAYAAACDDQWERAAELLGAAGEALLNDTASFIHFALLREQLVRPRLEPEVFVASLARGSTLDPDVLLADHGL
ncbi:MAG TPA: AAA family ATPase [Nocardioidaceae bacterium]|nr:AAA family ATPase [Nocardioidaceae bacterium]